MDTSTGTLAAMLDERDALDEALLTLWVLRVEAEVAIRQARRDAGLLLARDDTAERAMVARYRREAGPIGPVLAQLVLDAARAASEPATRPAESR